jgi:23S rRNA (uracil1939-C5)-methyltransferase
VAEFLLEIDHLDTAGDGVARHRGRTIAVPFTIPGERVRVALDARRGTASPVDIVNPSPHRVQPRCAHFGACGGCAWQHIAYPEQLRLKTAIVTRLVQRALPQAPAARPTLAATPLDDPWHYRQKVHFVFGPPPPGGFGGPGPARPLIMGHYARGSRRVIAVEECPVHDERGNEVAFGLFESCARIGGRRGLATLKSVAIRVSRSRDETMATLVVTSGGDPRLRAVTRSALAASGAPSSFHINVHPRGDASIFGPETRRVIGTERLRDEVSGVTFLISPTAFFQTNVMAAEMLVRLVLEAVPAGAAVLDLYAGAGLFALPLARRGHQVIAVEASRTAVADGEASLRASRIPADRCRFIAKPVHLVTRRPAFADRLRRGRPALVVILDPPREGCEAAVIDDVFGRIRPATAVYVSCNPDTLTRDLTRGARHGYEVRSLQPVDMFPHTPHIETVVVIGKTETAVPSVPGSRGA